jgi:hypothetical protein
VVIGEQALAARACFAIPPRQQDRCQKQTREDKTARIPAGIGEQAPEPQHGLVGVQLPRDLGKQSDFNPQQLQGQRLDDDVPPQQDVEAQAENSQQQKWQNQQFGLYLDSMP